MKKFFQKIIRKFWETPRLYEISYLNYFNNRKNYMITIDRDLQSPRIYNES